MKIFLTAMMILFFAPAACSLGIGATAFASGAFLLDQVRSAQ